MNSHVNIKPRVSPCGSKSEVTLYIWSVEKVAEQLKEAAETSRRMPPVRAQGYWTSWPEIIYSPNELMSQEPKYRRQPPTPEEISRLYQTFEWMPWVNTEERKIIGLRAKKVLWKTIAAKFKCHRSTVEHKWRVGLNKIAMRLNEQKQCPRG